MGLEVAPVCSEGPRSNLQRWDQIFCFLPAPEFFQLLIYVRSEGCVCSSETAPWHFQNNRCWARSQAAAEVSCLLLPFQACPERSPSTQKWSR